MVFHSDDMSSSPDPLNDSGIYTSPEKTQRRRKSSKSRARTSLPMNSSSPNKQTFELAVGSGISPQKLFVTVEAAKSDSDLRYPPSARREIVFPSPYRTDTSPSRTRERTTTTTIPLRGLSDTEDADQNSPVRAATPKRGRGRPRKSGTPIPKKADGRRVSMGDFDNDDDDDDDDIWDLSLVAGAARKGKGRSRSRSTTKKGTAKKAKATPRLSQGNVPDGVTPKKGRGRPKKVRQDEPAVVSNNDDTYEQNGAEASHDLNPSVNTNDVDTHDFGTMRTNTTIGNVDTYQYHPDVLLARFDDGMQTPNEQGWSSSHVISSGRPSTSKRTSPAEKDRWVGDDLQQAGDGEFDGPMDYSSDAETHEQSFGMGSPRSDSEEADAPPVEEGDQLEDNEDDYLSEAGDNVGELREFDTIMESEDFSMISVDSLREHLSPLNDDKDAAPGSNSTGGTTPSAKTGKAEDLLTATAPKELNALLPTKQQPPIQAFRGQHLNQQDDSFSSIAQSILDAASPAKGGRDLNPKVLQRESKSLSQPPEPRSGRSKSQNTPTKSLDIFRSATDAGSRDTAEEQGRNREHTPTAADTHMVDAVTLEPVTNSPRPSSRPSSHWSGLATPRESKSPTHGSVADGSAIDGSEGGLNEAEIMDEVVDQDTHMDSSPPPFVKSSPPQEMQKPEEAPQELPRPNTFAAHIQQQRTANSDMIETPSIVFSSPTLPPLNQQAAPARAAQLVPNATSSSKRPPLSSITRAGQVLQDVVTPSSPRTRSQSLGSPFTSPFKSRAGSATPAAEVYNARGHSQPVNGRRLSNFNLFTNVSDGTKRDLHESSSYGAQVAMNQRPSSSRSAVDLHEDPFRSDNKSQRRDPSSAEKGQYSLELPSERRLSNSSFRSSQTRNQDSSSWKPRQSSITEDVFFAAAQPAIDHNVQMTDASPLFSGGEKCVEKINKEAQETHAQRLEREWAGERKTVSQQIDAASTSQVIVLSSEKDDDAELADGQDEDGDGDVDIWQDEARHSSSSSMIEERDSKQPSSNGKQPSKQQEVEKPRRGKIPSPWRKNSKRLVYSDEIADTSTPADPRSKFLSPKQPEKTAEKSFPQKRQTAQESSRLDDDSQEFTGIWQTQMPQIPQKANFAPRPRNQLSQLEFSAFLEPSPRKSLPTPVTSESAGPSKEPASQCKTSRYSSPLVTAAVNRLNVSPPKTLQSSPFADTDNIEHEQDDYLSPSNENFGSDADWPEATSTPARSATTTRSKPSPKKPLSPFKSIVQKSIPANPALPKSTSQTSALLGESPFLSTIEWSKTHWRILDKILQNAKPLEARDVYSLGDMFVKESFFVGLEVDRDEEGFVTSRILGKEVFVEGQSMLLEQWHVEIIAIFREVVGWDDERALAKRLFGLVGAEERRMKKAKADAEAA